VSKVQSKNAILFDVVNDAGPLRDALVGTIGEATTTEPGLMAGADKEKLDGIATNSELRDRTTHTGEQSISTITGLVDALAEKATAAQGTKADTAVQPGAAVSVLAETSIAKIMSGDERTKLGALPDNASLNSALAERIALTEKGVANGVATLGADGKVPAVYLPSYVDDVLEYADFASLPVTGETGKIYVTLDANNQYRWSGSAYIEIVASPGSTDEVTEGTTNLYFTVARVRGVLLDGLSTAASMAITAGDSVLSAFGKLQAQVSSKAPIDNPVFTTSARIEGTGSPKIEIEATDGSAARFRMGRGAGQGSYEIEHNTAGQLVISHLNSAGVWAGSPVVIHDDYRLQTFGVFEAAVAEVRLGYQTYLGYGSASAGLPATLRMMVSDIDPDNFTIVGSNGTGGWHWAGALEWRSDLLTWNFNSRPTWNGVGLATVEEAAGGGTGVAGVSSFNGRTGTVSPQASDYSAGQVTYNGGSVAGQLDLLRGQTNLYGFDASALPNESGFYRQDGALSNGPSNGGNGLNHQIIQIGDNGRGFQLAQAYTDPDQFYFRSGIDGWRGWKKLANTDYVETRTPWVTPEMYGAVGDNVTDDTAAIQAMLNAIPATGAFVIWNRRHYCASGLTMTGKKSVTFIGRYASTTDAGSWIRFGSFSGHKFYVSDCSGFVMEGLNLYDPTPVGEAQFILVLDGGSNFSIERTCMIGAGASAPTSKGSCVWFRAGNRLRLSNNRWVGFNGKAVLLQSGSNPWSAAEIDDARVPDILETERNTFAGSSGVFGPTGVVCGSNGGSFIDSGNVYLYLEYGFRAISVNGRDSSFFWIRAKGYESIQKDAIRLSSGAQCIITGTYMGHSGQTYQDANGCGIVAEASFTGVLIITGNEIRGQKRHGINVLCNNVTITGNYISECNTSGQSNTYGINIPQGVGHCITGNNFNNLNSPTGLPDTAMDINVIPSSNANRSVVSGNMTPRGVRCSSGVVVSGNAGSVTTI